MNCNYRNFRCYFIALVIIFTGCTKGLEPIPSSFDISMSWSLPVGTGQVSFDKTLQTLGIPAINLTENVPDWAKHTYVFYRDTLPLNLAEVYNRDSTIDYMAFKVNIWNQFPVGGKAQIYFTDSEFNVIDSLWTDNKITIGPAVVTDYGMVIDAKYKNSTLEFDTPRIEKIKDSKNLVIEAGIELTDDNINENNVQYFDRFYLKIQVGVRVDFKIEDI